MASAGLYASLHLIPYHHANIPPLSFLQAGCPSCRPTNSIKALKELTVNISWLFITVCRFTHARMHNRFYSSLDFVLNNPGEALPKETFTHSPILIINHPLPVSSIAIHGILPVQFACLTVFLHNLCPSFFRSTSWYDTLHFVVNTFLHPIIVFFSQYMPIQLGTLSFSLTPHSHLTIFISARWSATPQFLLLQANLQTHWWIITFPQ